MKHASGKSGRRKEKRGEGGIQLIPKGNFRRHRFSVDLVRWGRTDLGDQGGHQDGESLACTLDVVSGGYKPLG